MVGVEWFKIMQGKSHHPIGSLAQPHKKPRRRSRAFFPNPHHSKLLMSVLRNHKVPFIIAY